MADEGLKKGGKFDRAMYFRRPDKPYHRRWITWGSRTHMEGFLIRGFEPLWKYGYVASDDPNPPWGTILNHPEGPLEFPAEQVISHRWYIPEQCPVPSVRFPQLQGNKVTHYPCPECERAPFIAVNGLGGIEDLARHLRLMHAWDRPSLMKYGEKVGLDFDVVYGDLKESFDFNAEPATVKCDECDFTVSPDSKAPAASLRMHKLGAHKQLEVEVVG